MPFRLFFIDKSRIFVSFSTLLLLDEPGRRPAPLRAVPTKPRAAVEVAIVLCVSTIVVQPSRVLASRSSFKISKSISALNLRVRIW